MSKTSKLLVTWGAGGSLAEVPGAYQDSGIQLLKQVSHKHSPQQQPGLQKCP